MNALLKIVGVLAGIVVIARIAQAPKVCVCPFCACGYPRR